MHSTPPENEHLDLTSYLLGELDPTEHARYERHLASCDSCRAEVSELERVVALSAASTGLDVEPPPGLADSVMAAIESDASAAAAPSATPAHRRDPGPPPVARRAWLPRVALGLAATAALAVAFLIGRGAGEDPGDPIGPGDPDAPLELQASIDGPGGGAELEVRRLASGREIEFVSDELPVLPEGEFYELWFVAGDDELPDSPDRISAGTFHPDEAGLTDVIMHAAVVPSLYPTIEVTRETDDRPASDGDVVLRLDAADLIRDG